MILGSADIHRAVVDAWDSANADNLVGAAAGQQRSYELSGYTDAWLDHNYAMVLRGGDDMAPSAYLASLGRPGSAENPAWGLCWWNNSQAYHRLPRTESEVRPGPVFPGAPADTMAARGAAENRLFVVPSLDLVVARTVEPTPGERPAPFDARFWELLTGA